MGSKVEIFAADVEDDRAGGVLWSPIGDPCPHFSLGLSPHGEAPWVDDTFSVRDNVAVLAQVVGDAVVALACKRGAGWKAVSSSKGVEVQEWKEKERRHWKCVSKDKSEQRELVR